MNQNKNCEVKDCTGKYQEKTISYVNLRAVNTKDYEISVNDYYKLFPKTGYHPVVSTLCDTCGDDLDLRLVSFINNNLFNEDL